MTDNVLQLRDFKRREEIEAAEARFIKRILADDTSPCEMPPVQPSFSAPDRDPA